MHQVVFTGRLLKGADRAKAESELQHLFKATPRQVEWFLRGKAIVVKSTGDLALALRYQEALTKAGLECELRSDRPATEPMAPPPEEPVMSQQQLPIPDVIPASAEPEPEPAHPPVQRRAPTLGPVTQAITAQDRAPEFVATPRPAVPITPAVTALAPLRTVLRLALLLIGAVLIGILAHGVREQWQARNAVALSRTPESASSREPGAGAPPSGTDATAASDETFAPQADTPETLIVGRWQCVEVASGRVVENEFSEDGRYRSLTHGKPDAFQQIDQLDILVEGRYRLDGDAVVLHVQSIPSREFFGSSAHADEYLYWRIDSLTRDAMIWADAQLQEVTESCLRSQSLPPP